MGRRYESEQTRDKQRRCLKKAGVTAAEASRDRVRYRRNYRRALREAEDSALSDAQRNRAEEDCRRMTSFYNMHRGIRDSDDSDYEYL